MTWSEVGTFHNGTGEFPFTPGGVGDLILAAVRVVGSNTIWCTGVSSDNATWVQMGDVFTGTVNSQTVVLFAGTVTSTDEENISFSFNGSPSTFHGVFQEFSSSVGSWVLDKQGTLDGGGTDTWPSLTPDGSEELYFGYVQNSAIAVAGSTSGYTYIADSDGAQNGMAYNTDCDGSAQAPVWGDSGQAFGIAVLVKEMLIPVVVQTLVANSGWSGDFDDAVTIGNSIVMAVSNHNGTDNLIENPVYNGASVDGAAEVVQAISGTGGGASAESSIWLLPDVQSSGTSLSITTDGGDGTYVGFIAYEVANLGTSPVIVQFNAVNDPGDTDDQAVSTTDPASAAGNFVIASIVQDNLHGGNIPVGTPWTSTGLPDNSAYNTTAGYLITTESGQTLDYDGGANSASWSAVIAEIAPGSGGVSASGALSLKKMVVAGTGSASGIVVTFLGNTAGALDIAPDVGDTVLIFVSMYDVSTGHSSDPTIDGTVVSDAVQVWEVQDSGSGDDMYSSAWMLPNVQTSSTDIDITSSGGSYPTPDGGFAFLGIKGLGSSPILDRVITAHANNGDSDIGPTSAIRHAQEVIVAQSAIYGSYADDGPGSPWTSPVIGTAKHGVLSYQTTDTSGGTYSWSEAGNNNAWAGGIATIAVTEDSVSITGTIKLKKMVLSGASAEKAVVTGTIKLKKMVLSGASAEKAVVTGTIKLKKMVLSGASAEKAVVTGAVSLKKMVLSGASAEKAVVTGAVSLKKMVLSGASAEKAVVTAAVKLKKMVLSGASAEKAVVTAAVKLKKMVLAGSSTKTVSASGAISLKKMVLSGASAEKAVVTGAVSLKKMVLAGAGTEKPAITGTIKLKKFVISGASHEKAVIIGSIHLNKMRLHGEEARRKSSNLFVFAPP